MTTGSVTTAAHTQQASYLVAGNVELDYVEFRAKHDGNEVGTCHGVAYLRQGERTWLRNMRDRNGWYWHKAMSFSGFLLSKD